MPTPPALLETLASYIPARLAGRIAQEPAVPETPSAERFPAAVLFADISGFTHMAERLAQRGPAGTEELRGLLNVFFEQLISLITSQGGDVIKFAGDALIALWPAHRGETLSLVTLRAAQCGLAAQKQLNNYPVAEDWKLLLRLGIGAGDVMAAHVGGKYGRWEYLLLGGPVVQMGAAERQAERGEVVLSPEAWALVHHNCLGHSLPDGGVRLEAVRVPLEPRPLAPIPPLLPEAEAALRAYIPAAITKRLAAGQTGWLAELRRATILFVQVIGLDEQNPELERIHAVMHSLQTALYYYEGSVRQFILDDKGAVLIAALGLPPLAHEDDAVRGVLAAMNMQAELGALGLKSAVGVTTGRAFCGSVGSAARHEYALVGDVVNLAARLMQQAVRGNDIFCDAATYQAARSRLAFEALTPVLVKGKTEPIAVYRPSGQVHRAARWPTALVGRAAEREQLARALEALRRDGEGGVIVIEGEPGIGKSRLVDDSLRLARRMGLPLFYGLGDAVEQATPYHAWRSVLRQLLDIGPNPKPEERRQRLLDRLAADPDMLARAPLLRNVLALDLPHTDLTADMTGQTRADNTRDLILHLVQGAVRRARRPRVLVLEDAHWMDSGSWAAAAGLGQRAAFGLPVLLIISLRPLPEPRPVEYRQLLDLPITQRLLLSALPPDDAVALACQRLGVAALPEPVAQFIRDKAEGHPFFTEELAYALRDSGVLVILDGQCSLARNLQDLRDVNFPDSVQGVITSRIDRLAPDQQLTLKVASVIGRVFPFRLLHDIHPIEADRRSLPETLAALERLDLTAPVAPEPNPAYTFKHSITQEVAYNLMLFAQRRELHRAIAEWYQRTYTADVSPYYPVLAHHWGKAQDPVRALDYLELAGEQALRSGAYQEAVGFYAEALRLEGEPGAAAHPSTRLRRARWERRLGEALYGLGRLVESREHLERAVATLGRPAPSTRGQLALDLLRLGALRLLRQFRPARHTPAARPREKIPWRPPTDQLTARLTTLLETVRAYERLSQIHYLASNPVPGLHAVLTTLNLAERLGPSQELARAFAGMCVAAGVFSFPALARLYRQRALSTVQKVREISAEAWVLATLAIYEVGVGQWAEAEMGFARAVEIFERLGSRRDWGNNQVGLCWVYYFRGEFERGALLYAALHQTASQQGNTELQAWAFSGEALHRLHLGQHGQAVALWEQALPLLEVVTESRVTETLTYGGLAVAHLRRGEPQLAREAADMAAQLVRRSPAATYAVFDGFAGPAEVYLSLWEAEGGHPKSEFKTLARQACQAMHRYARAYPIGQPRAWLYQGWYDRLDGQPARAHQAWRKSLTYAARLAMPYEQGLAHLELGQQALPDQVEHLSKAADIFAALNAAHFLARARQAEKA
jgi:class 3 adenylate cyclase